MTNEAPGSQAGSPGSPRKALYTAVWRWHFYAGLYVAPFLLMLATTGLVMLADGPLERWQLGGLLVNAPGGEIVSHQARLDAARSAVPNATFLRYQPGRDTSETTRVAVSIDGAPHTVFVDAAGEVRGVVDDGRRIRAVAERVHGTLLIGTIGDRLIELAASLGVVLLVSGVYLWMPRTGTWRGALSVAPGAGRLTWRDLHKAIGILLAPVLLFYLLSGLAWSGIWGERFVQAWSSLGMATAPPRGGAAHGHGALNGASEKVVPWNLEQTPLPESVPAHAHHAAAPTLDAVIEVAKPAGIGPSFWVGLPQGDDGVWTVAQTAMNKDIVDPRQELTIHIDRQTGAVIGRAAWSDYAPPAKMMAAGIPLHQGSLGAWNLVASAAVCLAVMLLTIAGLVSWWLRRPSRVWALAPPPRPDGFRVPAAVWLTALTLGVLFPVAGAVIVAVLGAEWAVVSRVPALRRWVG